MFIALAALVLTGLAVIAEDPLDGPQQSKTGPTPPDAVLQRDAERGFIPAPLGATVIAGVPDYNWRHGCGPTAVGMVVGYYDGQSYDDLVPGDVSTQNNDANQAMASGGVSGNPADPCQHYEDYSCPEDTFPVPLTDAHITQGRPAHPDDCIGDYMRTSQSTHPLGHNYYGWSWSSDVGPSFVGYVNQQNATYAPSYTEYRWSTGAMTWAVLTNEIDNNRPMVFLVDTNGNGDSDHFVTVIGYDDSTNEYGCYDTWSSSPGIRWEIFQGVGNDWGIWGGWSFELLQLGTKWEQLPDMTSNGMDIRCDRGDGNDIPRVLADDFLCETSGPITKVIFWGSWKDDIKGQIKKIHLSIHNDNPNGPMGWSEPNELLWEKDFFGGDFNETLYSDYEPEWFWDPLSGDPPIEVCDWEMWQYEIPIDPCDAFMQEGDAAAPVIYWLDIWVTLELEPYSEFGWKTSDEHWNDDAVDSNDNGSTWYELRYPPEHILYHDSIDLSFVIITGEVEEPNEEIKWSQPPVLWQEPNIYIGWDEESTDLYPPMVLDDFRCDTNDPLTALRWWGSFKNWYYDWLPDGLPKGFYLTIWDDIPASEPETKWIQNPDLSDTGLDVDATYCEVVGDDFPCWETGPITDIHIWGSWYNDQLPFGDANEVDFTLSIYSNNPVGPFGWSEPDELLWSRNFWAGEFDVSVAGTDLGEGWYMPCESVYEPFADNICWKYDFYIDPCDTFIQQGDPNDPNIYWLVVEAHPNDVDTFFGVKTRDYYDGHYEDDAVWSDDYVNWYELRYPIGHQFELESIDLAFEITTQEEPYSHPNEIIWENYCYTYDVNFYGWEYDPRSGVVEVAKFEFYQELLDPCDYWFQPGDDGIYWLGILALYEGNEPNYAWGWETRPHFFMDDAVRLWECPEPGVPAPAEYFEPIEFDGNSWDLSFELISMPSEPELEFGDAPEGATAYPTLSVTGAFPTCMNVVIAGWIQHNNFGAHFGPTFDFENEGNAGLCPLFTPNAYDNDECFMDGDAGLIIPEPYTIQGAAGSEVVVPCPASTGTSLGNTCQTAVWGVNIDIDVTNFMPSMTDGYVNVLVDWNQDGQWSSSSMCPSGAVPEHVLVDFPVFNGYLGPLSALGPPSFTIGPNPGYVWVRFSITEVPVATTDWNGEGIFEDGETEDYLLRVDIESKPPVPHLKWSQPPIELDPTSPAPIYCGWDQLSYTDDPCCEYGAGWQVVADDYRCLGSMPASSVHWWGSYIGWEEPEPPDLGGYDVGVVAWRIGFWSNVPVGIAEYSYPEELLWEIEVDASRVEVVHVGRDWFPSIPNGGPAPLPQLFPDTCFQYHVDLDPTEYFWQDDYNDVTEDNIFWLSIAAIYPQESMPYYPWGWKTRPWHWMDDAVTFSCPILEPGMILDPVDVTPIEDPVYFESYDVAFELDTEPNYIKWEQAFDSIRHWEHYEDEQSIADEGGIIRLVADDWHCERRTPIVATVWWGSYIGYPYEACQGPQPPPVKPDHFLLNIWTDVPAGADANYPYSHPGDKIWEYKAYDYDEVLVGYDKHPWQVPGPPREPVFRYSVRLPQEEWFLQEEASNIYWFSVVAVYDVAAPNYDWGWTNHPHMYNDDAVAGTPTGPDEWLWEELHDQNGDSEDMSFVLFTEPKCLKRTAPEYNDWVSWGEPDCWCYKRQCRGDADGIKTLIFWVAVPDLNLLRSAFNKTDLQLATIPNGICADFDHIKTLIFRVAVPDLNILRAYFNQGEALVPCCDNNMDCILDATDKYNFWTN